MSENKAFRDFRAILFDWAGTTIDHGSIAPVRAVMEVFQEFELPITEAEAREPMGKAKLDHIRCVLAMPRVAESWKLKYTNEEDLVQRIYATFLVTQKKILQEYARPIEGVVEGVSYLRSRGIRIGSTTGYTRPLMDVVVPAASALGYKPEVVLCADDVPAGRPAPWLNFRAAEKLGVYPMNRVMIVDDSVVGIQAGKNAGAYSVAVTRTGNAIGLSFEDVNRLPKSELNARLETARNEFLAAGADLVVESVADLVRMFKDQE